MRKFWSSKDVELIKDMRKKGFHSKDIAKNFEVSTNALDMKIKKLAKKGKIKVKKWIRDDNYTFKNIKLGEQIIFDVSLLDWACPLLLLPMSCPTR